MVRMMSTQNLWGCLNFSTMPLSFLFDFVRSSVRFYTFVVSCLTLTSISFTSLPAWLILDFKFSVFSIMTSTWSSIYSCSLFHCCIFYIYISVAFYPKFLLSPFLLPYTVPYVYSPSNCVLIYVNVWNFLFGLSDDLSVSSNEFWFKRLS